MNLTWLGQAGYYLVSPGGLRIMIDPYLSDALCRAQGEDFLREVPIDPAWCQAETDVLVITHCHADHMDFETLDCLLLRDRPVSVLAPLNVWQILRARCGGAHNYIQFDHGIEVSIGDVLFCSVFAAHSDERAIGILLQSPDCVLYHTGDTLCHRRIFEEIDRRVNALLLPINGQGNNMNAVDAARFTRRIQPDLVLPMHFDMFRKFGCGVGDFYAQFTADEQKKILVPEHYKEYCLWFGESK